MSTTKPLDIVVFGATSFVGRILTSYLARTYGVGGEVKWGIAGRSETRLADLRIDLGDVAQKLPIIVADADLKGSRVPGPRVLERAVLELAGG